MASSNAMRTLLVMAFAIGGDVAGAATPSHAAMYRQVADERCGADLAMARRTSLADHGMWSTAPVADGLAWLEADQDPTGSWGAAFMFVDTCTVLETLAAADPTCTQLPLGAAWLGGQGAENYEYLARQVTALAGAAGFEGLAGGLAADLMAVRNPAGIEPALPNYPEGGWGLAAGYETDCLTTAIALLALEATGYNGGFSVANRALAASGYNIHEWDIPTDATTVRIFIQVAGTTVHLRMAEGAPPMSGMGFQLPPGNYQIVYPDSGLPFTPGHNYIVVQNLTATAGSYTMTAAYETPTFNTLTLAEPLNYLLAAQNADGGWGLQRGRDTEFYTTLHVLLALLKYSNYALATPITNGVNYVRTQQLAGGGFGYSGIPLPYVTALACLGLVRSENYPYSTGTQNAIAALRAMQHADGSWVQEPYDTALAVLALWDHNRTPTVNAGADQWILLTPPDTTADVTLDGSASDVDGSIVSYVWTESGAEIATGATPTVTLSFGRHVLTLTVTDDGGKPANDEVVITVAQAAYQANMDTNPGWTAQGLWQWGVPLGNDGSHGGQPPNGPDPTSGCTGPRVYGYNLAGGYQDNLPATYLTTPAIDCTGYSGVRLKFCRWLCVEESQYDHASLQVSNDGANWTTLFNHVGGTFIETAWSQQDYDISTVADDQATVYVRWAMGPTDFTWNYGGWNIDDVIIAGVPAVAPPPHVQGLEVFYSGLFANAADPSHGFLATGSTATHANITNYLRGITGIRVFFDVPVTFAAGAANAFVFEWTTGADTTFTPATATATVTEALQGGGTAVTITFAGDAVRKRWLKVRIDAAQVLAGGTALDGELDGNPVNLPSGDGAPGGDAVFYLGNQPGDVNDDRKTLLPDAALIRSQVNPLVPVPIENVYDVDKSGKVLLPDASGARADVNPLFTLPLIAP